MRFSTRVAVCTIVGFGVLSGSPVVRAENAANIQQLENQAFVDLAQLESSKVEHAAYHFKMSKTPAVKVVARVLALMQVPQNQISNENLNTLIGLLDFYGPEAKAAIPQLLEITAQFSNANTRTLARSALVKIGPNDERVFSALRRILQTSQKPEDVVNAAQSLAKMGPIARRAIPELNRQLRALNKSGFFEYSAVGNSQYAYYALGEIALKNSALPSVAEAIKILQAIHKTAPDKSILAFLSLQKAGRKADAAIPTLLGLIARDEEYSQGAAIDTLGFIGPGANPRVTQVLLKIMDREIDSNAIIPFSYSAFSALMKATPQDVAAVPLLAETLKSPKNFMRTTAAQALAKIGAASSPAAENLSFALRLGMTNFMGAGEWTQYIRLAKVIGKDEGGLLNTILKILDSAPVAQKPAFIYEETRANLWIVVADILIKSGDEIEVSKRRAIAARVLEAMPLSMQSEHPQWLIYAGTARVAGALGEDAKDIVPILMTAIQTEVWRGTPIWGNAGMIYYGEPAMINLKMESIKALGRIGKSAAPALPLLQSVVEKNQPEDFLFGSRYGSAEAARVAMKLINAAA